MSGQCLDWGSAAAELWCWGAWCQLWPQLCHAPNETFAFLRSCLGHTRFLAGWFPSQFIFCATNHFLYRYIIFSGFGSTEYTGNPWHYCSSCMLCLFFKKNRLLKHFIFVVAMTLSLQMDFLSSKNWLLQKMCSKIVFVDCIIFIY